MRISQSKKSSRKHANWGLLAGWCLSSTTDEGKPGEDWGDPAQGGKRQVRKTPSKEVLSLCLWSQSRGPRRQTKRGQSPPLCSPPFASLLTAWRRRRRPHPLPPPALRIPSHLKRVRAENNAVVSQRARPVELTDRVSASARGGATA